MLALEEAVLALEEAVLALEEAVLALEEGPRANQQACQDVEPVCALPAAPRASAWCWPSLP